MSNIPAQRGEAWDPATTTAETRHQPHNFLAMALTKRRGFAEARSDQSDTSETELLTKDEPKSPSETPKAGESFCTAKHAILRSLAAVYAVAFLAAWQQNGALIGEKGLVPAKPAFDRERAATTSALEGFMSKPSLFWWMPMDDAGLDGVSAAGLGLSLLVLLGLHSSVAMLALWLLYFTVTSLLYPNHNPSPTPNLTAAPTRTRWSPPPKARPFTPTAGSRSF